MTQPPSVRRIPQGVAPLMRRNAFASAIAAGLFVLPAVPVMGATITVGGSCTLVNSIIAANTDTNAGGACNTAGSGADIIVLPANSTQTLTTAHNNTYGDTGLPVVTSQILIQGNDSVIQRSGSAPNFRIFAVAGGGGDLTLERTTVSGGTASSSGGGGITSRGLLTLDRSVVSGNGVGQGRGGGIYSNGGNLIIRDSTVSGNSVYDGSGGGIYLFDANLSLFNSTVAGNSSFYAGGGIGQYKGAGITTIANSTISGNSAGGYGAGGLSVSGDHGPVYVRNTTISDNRSENIVGGVYVSGTGTVQMVDSTVSGNNAPTGVGGIVAQKYASLNISRSTISGNTGFAGGLTCFGCTLDLSNSTVSGNTAKYLGGGILNVLGTATLVNSTITANRILLPSDDLIDLFGGDGFDQTVILGGGIFNLAGSLSLVRSIVSGNTSTDAYSGREIFNFDSSGLNLPPGSSVINADAYNVFSHSYQPNTLAFYQFSPGATDLDASANGGNAYSPQSILNPLLADNGGPTFTHALPLGSPAIDLSAAVNCFGSTDQRGVNRPKDGNGSTSTECDSGAYERGFNFTNTAITKTGNGPVIVGNNLTYTLALTNTGPEQSSDVEVADSLPAGLNFVSATPSQGTCEFELGTLSCELGEIPGNGGTAIISLVTATTAVGQVTNTASFITDAIDSNANDDFDDDDTTNVLDDSPPPAVRFILGTNAVGEGAGAHSITVQLSAVSANDVSVPFTVQGTATAADYSGLSASPLLIPAGSLSTTLNFDIVNDSVDEPDETLIFTLTGPSNATLGSPTKSLLTIKDNDAPPADTTPNAFNFVDKKGVKAKTHIISNTITVGGLSTGTSVPVTLTNGTGGDASYSINGAAFRKTPATVKNGDKVRLRNKIPGNSGTATCTLSIGGVSDGWKITTSK